MNKVEKLAVGTAIAAGSLLGAAQEVHAQDTTPLTFQPEHGDTVDENGNYGTVQVVPETPTSLPNFEPDHGDTVDENGNYGTVDVVEQEQTSTTNSTTTITSAPQGLPPISVEINDTKKVPEDTPSGSNTTLMHPEEIASNSKDSRKEDPSALPAVLAVGALAAAGAAARRITVNSRNRSQL